MSIKKILRIIEKTATYYKFKGRIKDQIEIIKSNTNSPYIQEKNGHSNGITFYTTDETIKIISSFFYLFKKKLGYYPNIVDPKGFNEKVLWSKFFADIKIPESGNKLLTSRFIPNDLKEQIQCPRIHWNSSFAKLPRNNEIIPGSYYLKATHGSGLFQRITYPMKEHEIIKLEKVCDKWLKSPYGLEKGEWWYNIFQPEIIIDEDIVGEERSIAYDFFVFSGNVEHIVLHRKGNRKKGELEQLTRMDSDFQPLPESEQTDKHLVEQDALSDETKRTMKYFASRIGGDAPFVRVDFVLGKGCKPYLIEVTLSPGNGLAKRTPELERWLGDKWKL